MKEITELDNKYLVLKWGDIEKLPTRGFLGATALCNQVKRLRRDEGKSFDDVETFIRLAEKYGIAGTLQFY